MSSDTVLQYLGEPKGEFMAVIPLGYAMRPASAPHKQALDVTSRAYVLEQGRIVREGESRTLANDPEIAAHYLGQDTNSA